MELSGQLHALDTLLWERLLVSVFTGDWVGPIAGVDVLEKRKSSCLC